MVRRGKTQMKLIEDPARRHVTFSKRRIGLFKKALELSVLCDAEIGLLVFSEGGKLTEFASASSMQETIHRYQSSRKNNGNHKTVQQDMQNAIISPTQAHSMEESCQLQQLKADTTALAKKIEPLEDYERKILGKNIQGCSVEELKSLEANVQMSLHKIREKKTQLLEQKIAELEEKTCTLLKENEDLLQKELNLETPLVAPDLNTMAPVQLCDVVELSNWDANVDTELYIGLRNSELTENH